MPTHRLTGIGWTEDSSGNTLQSGSSTFAVYDTATNPAEFSYTYTGNLALGETDVQISGSGFAMT